MVTIEVQYAGQLGRDARGIGSGGYEKESRCEDESSSLAGSGGGEGNSGSGIKGG